MNYRLTISLFFLSVSGWVLAQPEQEDSVQYINPLFVTAFRQAEKDSGTYRLGPNQIQRLQAEDLGELCKHLPGTTLKSYGALGGLKTINVRGLSSHHSAIVTDGFTLNNAQTGQINLGQIQVEQVQSIQLNYFSRGTLNPVSADLMGNTLAIQSIPDLVTSTRVRIGYKNGSFGLHDGYLELHQPLKKLQTGITTRYRTMTGNYPYQIDNYAHNYSGIRANNHYAEMASQAYLKYRWSNKHSVRIIGGFTNIRQELPGAVVLYNDWNNQHLATQNLTAKADYQFQAPDISGRVYFSTLEETLNYIDSNYLNAQGFLHARYKNQNLQAGTVWNKTIRRLEFSFGHEYQLFSLRSNNGFSFDPKRHMHWSKLGASYNWKGYHFHTLIGLQNRMDLDEQGQVSADLGLITPSFSLSKQLTGHYLSVGYRYSVRPAGFNELYFNSIGNNHLKPERAQQFFLHHNKKWTSQKSPFETSLGVFYNQVEDKIVAIPTKNLFVWMIENIGLVKIYGADFQANWGLSITQHLSIQTSGNYTYQRALDFTDPTGTTYKHQIAYTPEHTVNLEQLVAWKKHQVRFGGYFVGKRYALNQNILTNSVDPFAVFDVSYAYRWTFGHNQAIAVRGTVKNILNSSYAYIRNFVMPGRNYLISIRYELH